MKNDSLLIVFSTVVLGLLSYLFLNNIIISILMIITGTLFFIIAQKNNENRKENLNIIRDEDTLYFYLSDDLLFSVDLTNNKSIKETLREAFHKESHTLQNITRKICFINFREDSLLDELNNNLMLK